MMKTDMAKKSKMLTAVYRDRDAANRAYAWLEQHGYTPHEINVLMSDRTRAFYGTTGVGPDLYAAAQDAVRAMVAHISMTYDLSGEDAYVLSSLCVDLKISEIVDAGQYVVSAVLPLAVFR